MRFFDWLGDQWRVRPWAVLLAVMALAVLFDARQEIFSSRRPVGAAAEALVASAIYWGSLIGSVAAGIWAGGQVQDRTNSTALAWVVGIAAFIAVGFAVLYAGKSFPGVGWRIDKMMQSSDDYGL